MAYTPNYVDATFYVQIEPEFSRFDRENPNSAKVVRMSQSKPSRPIGGAVMVKMTIRLPVAAFKPLLPEAVVVVPESMTAATPIEVIVEDPAVQG